MLVLTGATDGIYTRQCHGQQVFLFQTNGLRARQFETFACVFNFAAHTHPNLRTTNRFGDCLLNRVDVL